MFVPVWTSTYPPGTWVRPHRSDQVGRLVHDTACHPQAVGAVHLGVRGPHADVDIDPEVGPLLPEQIAGAGTDDRLDTQSCVAGWPLRSTVLVSEWVTQLGMSVGSGEVGGSRWSYVSMETDSVPRVEARRGLVGDRAGTQVGVDKSEDLPDPRGRAAARSRSRRSPLERPGRRRAGRPAEGLATAGWSTGFARRSSERPGQVAARGWGHGRAGRDHQGDHAAAIAPARTAWVRPRRLTSIAIRTATRAGPGTNRSGSANISRRSSSIMMCARSGSASRRRPCPCEASTAPARCVPGWCRPRSYAHQRSRCWQPKGWHRPPRVGGLHRVQLCVSYSGIRLNGARWQPVRSEGRPWPAAVRPRRTGPALAGDLYEIGPSSPIRERAAQRSQHSIWHGTGRS
jgi:hypothetical protein